MASFSRNAVLEWPEHRVKVSLRSHALLPKLALVDPENLRVATAVAVERTELVGFFKPDLEQIMERRPGMGVKFDVPYRKNADGTAEATLTDPWGVTIELTEGLRAR